MRDGLDVSQNRVDWRAYVRAVMKFQLLEIFRMLVLRRSYTLGALVLPVLTEGMSNGSSEEMVSFPKRRTARRQFSKRKRGRKGRDNILRGGMGDKNCDTVSLFPLLHSVQPSTLQQLETPPDACEGLARKTDNFEEPTMRTSWRRMVNYSDGRLVETVAMSISDGLAEELLKLRLGEAVGEVAWKLVPVGETGLNADLAEEEFAIESSFLFLHDAMYWCNVLLLVAAIDKPQAPSLGTISSMAFLKSSPHRRRTSSRTERFLFGKSLSRTSKEAAERLFLLVSTGLLFEVFVGLSEGLRFSSMFSGLFSSLQNLSEVHPTEIRTSNSPSSAFELNTTSALANYATEAGTHPFQWDHSISTVSFGLPVTGKSGLKSWLDELRDSYHDAQQKLLDMVTEVSYVANWNLENKGRRCLMWQTGICRAGDGGFLCGKLESGEQGMEVSYVANWNLENKGWRCLMWQTGIWRADDMMALTSSHGGLRQPTSFWRAGYVPREGAVNHLDVGGRQPPPPYTIHTTWLAFGRRLHFTHTHFIPLSRPVSQHRPLSGLIRLEGGSRLPRFDSKVTCRRRRRGSLRRPLFGGRDGQQADYGSQRRDNRYVIQPLAPPSWRQSEVTLQSSPLAASIIYESDMEDWVLLHIRNVQRRQRRENIKMFRRQLRDTLNPFELLESEFKQLFRMSVVIGDTPDDHVGAGLRPTEKLLRHPADTAVQGGECLTRSGERGLGRGAEPRGSSEGTGGIQNGYGCICIYGDRKIRERNRAGWTSHRAEKVCISHPESPPATGPTVTTGPRYPPLEVAAGGPFPDA
uniref:Uncharacterized protein n=1 Tax=Timema douglasi TaxID=61478 RepID=A0A7R8Z979_TIMDO|nr:unnamed protein product [Timema douglasi]